MTYELRAKSYIIAPIGWMAFIFALSSIPGQAFEILPMSSIITNLAHIPLFGGLAYLWMRAFRNKEVNANNRKSNTNTRENSPSYIRDNSRLIRINSRSYIYSIIITLCYAAFDEFHQSFVPGREASFADFIFDTLGCALALFIYKKRFLYKKEK